MPTSPFALLNHPYIQSRWLTLTTTTRTSTPPPSLLKSSTRILSRTRCEPPKRPTARPTPLSRIYGPWANCQVPRTLRWQISALQPTTVSVTATFSSTGTLLLSLQSPWLRKTCTPPRLTATASHHILIINGRPLTNKLDPTTHPRRRLTPKITKRIQKKVRSQ